MPSYFLRSLTLSVMGLAAIPAIAEEFFIKAEAFAYSETVPIYAYFHDLDGKYRAGTTAFTHDEIETGASYGQLTISALYRYDYFLDFSKDAFELVYGSKNDLPVAPNRNYKVRIDANHFIARGIKLAWQIEPLSSFTAKAGIAYLKAEDLLAGDIHGQIQTRSDNSYSGEVDINYAYDHDFLFNRKSSSPTGEGYTTDLTLSWALNTTVKAYAKFDDILSEINWNNAPYTLAHVTSATSNFDSNGFLHTTPVLAGTEGYRHKHQRLPMRSTVGADYALNDQYSVGASLFQISSTSLPKLHIQRQDARWGDLGLSYDLVAHATGISYRKYPFEFGLTSDSLDYQKAHTLGLSFGLHTRW